MYKSYTKNVLTFYPRNALGLHGEAGWLLYQLTSKPQVDILRFHGLDSELWLGQLYHPLPGMKLYIIHRTCRVIDLLKHKNLFPVPMIPPTPPL